MHLSVQCAEEMPFTSAARIEALAVEIAPEIHRAVGGADYVRYCQDWPVAAAPSRENEAVSATIPTLALAGRFDPVTPPAYAELAAKTLAASYVVLLQSESHGASVGECGKALLTDFLEEPTREPRASCASSVPEPQFEGRGVAETAGAARILRAGAPPQFALQPPTPEQVKAVRRDLESRLRL
jgi:hypothetical protein